MTQIPFWKIHGLKLNVYCLPVLEIKCVGGTDLIKREIKSERRDRDVRKEVEMTEGREFITANGKEVSGEAGNDIVMWKGE